MQGVVSIADIQKRARWYVAARWFYLIGIGVPSIAVLLAANGFAGQAQQDIELLAAVLGVNALFLASTHIRARQRWVHMTLVSSQIVFDLVLMSVAFYLNAGGESPLAMFYAIPIVMTAAFFGRRAIFVVGLAATSLYMTLSLLDYLKILPVQHISAPQLHTDPQLFLPVLVSVVTIFLVLTTITARVGELIQEREQLALEMKLLSEHNAEIEAILKTMGSALVAVDRGGRITLVNDSFEELTGWRKKEVVGQPLDVVLPLLDGHGKRVPADKRPMLEFITDAQRVRRQLGVRALSGFSYVRKNGSIFPFVGNVAPIEVRGDIVGFTTVFDDATEVKKLNQLKDNFIALISHQLKTPIGEINGYAYNLLGGVAGKLKPKQAEYATAIQEQAARSGKLIADLLDIALAGEGNLAVHSEPVAVASVLDQVVAMRKPLAQKKHLKLEAHKVDKSLRARGDEHKLVQVLVNLVDNAIRYTPAGSVTLSVVAGDKEVEIYVNDTGSGMDPDLRERLFGAQSQDAPLTRAPTAEGGTGLGVYLAKQLAALMDGSIRVVSSSSRGTTIAVALKRAEP